MPSSARRTADAGSAAHGPPASPGRAGERRTKTAGSVSVLRYLTSGPVLRRNAAVALVVGVVLSGVNQMEFILSGSFPPVVVLKIAFNFLVPFTVASVSAALNRNDR